MTLGLVSGPNRVQSGEAKCITAKKEKEEKGRLFNQRRGGAGQ